MALTLDPATRTFSSPQSDHTLVSGTLYDVDTDQLRKDMFDLLASEDYIWLPDAYVHNTEVTVAGTTYARTLELINSFKLELTPDSQWTARLNGSNNNLFDVENGILVQNQVQVIPTNSAGLIRSATGLSAADLTAIRDEVIAGLETPIATPAAGSPNDILSDLDAVLPVTAISTLTAPEVNSEVVDVLVTDTHAEPTAPPGATSSIRDALMWLKTLARNKILQTSTQQTIRNDADSADIATATLSDDGTTLTRGEFT